MDQPPRSARTAPPQRPPPRPTSAGRPQSAVLQQTGAGPLGSHRLTCPTNSPADIKPSLQRYGHQATERGARRVLLAVGRSRANAFGMAKRTVAERQAGRSGGARSAEAAGPEE